MSAQRKKGRKRSTSRRAKTARGARTGAVGLGDTRARINALDRRLVELLNERAALVVRVGKLKRKAGLSVYAPHREAEVLDRALALNKGPLPKRTLEAVYRELMSGSFSLQQPMRVAYLGPEGSYSHLAAIRHFGRSVSFEKMHDIEGVFSEVSRGHVQHGMVPVENTIGGGVIETLDAFRDHVFHGGKTEITICAEVQLGVRHALLSNGEPRGITRIYSKPEVLTQCRGWLARQYPKADLIATPSSSKAAEVVAQETADAVSAGRAPTSAAIGSELAGRLNGLHVLFEGIEDHPGNVTRFFVLSRQPTPRSGDDKTSVLFGLGDKPGALVHVLRSFADQNINLTHIEKRPSGRKNWTYAFFIDAVGHREEPEMQTALAVVKHHCSQLVVLGSYPRSKRVL